MKNNFILYFLLFIVSINIGNSQEVKITPDDGMQYSYFGQSVSIFENTLVVGAPINPYNAGGKSYIYELINNNWEQINSEHPSNIGVNNTYGWTTAISDQFIAVGAPTDTSSEIGVGAIFIYEKNDDLNWELDIKLIGRSCDLCPKIK